MCMHGGGDRSRALCSSFDTHIEHNAAAAPAFPLKPSLPAGCDKKCFPALPLTPQLGHPFLPSLSFLPGPQRAHEKFAAFYDQLYSVCHDREGLLSVMLARKEQFAQQALRNMLRSELGVGSARFVEE